MPPSSDLVFPASYDRTTKIVSAVAAVVLIIPALATRSIAVGCLCAPILLLTYLWSPRGYRISGGRLVVRRSIGNVEIPIDSLREVRRAASDDLSGAIRLWGNGGLFGYYGLFRTSKLGKCSWYVTNRANIVVLVAEGRTVLVSPDDADGFLAAIGPAVPSGAAVPSAGNPTEFGGHGRLATTAGISIAVLVVGIVILAFGYSPGPPAYTLTPTSLAINDRFYPVTVEAGNVDADRIRVIDIRSDPTWRPTARTNGFANGHYHSGWFRGANGQTVRMYWANGSRLVLLPAKGSADAVLLEVNAPEAFIAELHRVWQTAPPP